MTRLMTKTAALCAALLLLAPLGEVSAASAKKISPLSDSIRKMRRMPAPGVREAFRKFTSRHGSAWKVRYSPRTALPEAVTGGEGIRYGGTPEQAAAAFLNDNKDLLKADPQALRLVNKKEFLGVTHLQYQQYKDGIPVEFAYARVHVSAEGRVTGYQAKFEPDLGSFPAPAVSESAAVMAAAADLGRPLPATRVELVVFPDEESGERRLAWKIRARNNGLWVYYVDAASGKVLLKYDALHRAGCPGYLGAVGTSSGTVYEISPIPTDPASGNMQEISWTGPKDLGLRDQYVWVGGYSSMTVTNRYGDYCTNQAGKAYSSLKGPYFAVTNFRGESARWTNGTFDTVTPATPLQSPHPYDNSQTYEYPVTLSDIWTPAGKTFAMALPRFTSFSAGELDIYGSMNDADQVQILNNGLSGNSMVASYTGLRRNAFYGASVEYPSFNVKLKTDGSGTYNGFVIDHTKVLMLGAGHAATSNPTGSVVWKVGQSGVYLDNGLGDTNALAEGNAFYHLNKVRRFFDPLNLDPVSGNPPADLSRRVPVMVHAHGDADMVGQSCGTGCGGMLNAYYDLENDNIMMGDGPMDVYGKYRNFALDGTIVRHEYIHLVVNRIYPIINYGEFGAISEAMADYFALASFWSDTCGPACTSLTKLGNFIGSGEASTRDISGAAPTGLRTMPDDWWGEVHEDSLPLSQALYKLTPAGSRSLGTFAAGTYAGLRKADVLTYAALFYFPDTFANFKDAMLDACRQFNVRWAGSCNATAQASISNAFSDHGIGTFAGGDAYEASPTSALCTSNNGPECAAELEDASSINATIYPMADVDYYSIPLAAGNFTATLELPAGSQEGTYTAYSVFLFDAGRDYVSEAVPEIYNTYDGYCPSSGDCLTLSRTVTLSYAVPKAGRYYLVVAAAPNEYYGNSEANSQLPYTLKLDRTPAGSAAARLYAASYDNDELSFEAPFSLFAALSWPSSSTVNCAMTGSPGCPEQFFEYAQLRDHNYAPLDLTRTNLTGAYMADLPVARAYHTDSFGVSYVSGRVKLQPGFGARYPGVGTVYLELFGRNHLGHVVSLGVSNPVNLSASAAEVTAYNNIITGAGGSAIIKYAVTSPGSLSIKVYTQSGSLVKTVFDGPVPAGKGTVDWDGTNSSGGKAASGIYFVKTKGPGLDRVVKVAVVR